MKTTRFLGVMLASALTLCVNQEADAQFGKLAKRIKDDSAYSLRTS